MLQKNIINRLIFDIRFDSGTDAFRREESLESFTCNRLMPVVDKVLSLHSANGALIRIGSLEVDLGDLSHEDFREKMPERLKERLDAAIREKLRSLKGSTSRQEGVFSRREANYRLIEYFLSTGTLPWTTDLKTDLSFSRLLQDVLGSDGARLVDFLKRSGPGARKRLVRQFPAQDLIALVHLLAPDHYQFVIDTVEAIDQLQQKTAFMPDGRGAAVPLTWDLVFDYLLDKVGERLNEKLFISSILQEFSSRHHLIYSQVLFALRKAVEAAQPPGPMQKRVLGIATELEDEFTTETQLRKEPTPESLWQIRGIDLYAFLELYLMDEAVHEMMPGDSLSSLAGRTVRELQRDHPQVLLRLLKALQSQPDAIRRIATRLSADQLQQFTTALLVLVLLPKKARQGELHTAIARWADQAADKSRYYAEVLDAVVRGERIDLEIIVAGTQKHTVPEPVTGAGAESADPDLTASYLTWFLTVPPTDHQERILYRSLLERFMIDSPEAFGRYLTGIVKEPSRRAAFVRLTPWRLIRKAVEGFADVARYVAILEGIFRPGTPSPRCQPEDFVRIVIDVLSEQPHPDGEAFFKTAFGRLLMHTGDTTARKRAVDTLERIVSAKGVRAPAGLRSIAAQYRQSWDIVPTGYKTITEIQAPKEAAVLAYLKDDLPALPASLATLEGALEAMILHTSEELYQFIAAHLDHSGMVAKLIALLSEPFLARLLHLLIPRNYSRAQRYVDLLRNAAYSVWISDSSDKISRLIWEVVFIYLRETGLRVFDEGAFVRRIIEFLAEKKNMDRAILYADLGRQIAADIQPSTRSDSQLLIRIVSEAAQKSGRSETSSSELQAQPAKSISQLKKDEKEAARPEEIYVTNAGMVIAAPYLPRLFELLKLTEKSRFKSREATERGVHLLQYLVDARTNTPEYQLVLNKLLCGVKPGLPIVRGIEITEEETEAITGLITAMIQNWKLIGNTSVAGFRESFLQREGRLMRKEDAWHLQVEQRAFDMLLDQIPWSFSTIKYSWMDRIIFVQWR
jgi:hypothetical protein